MAKRHTVKNYHAIIYTGNRVPATRPGEMPTKQNEAPMRDPVHVVPTRPEDSLDPMSRINYEKVYTIEKNWKFLDFGQVDGQHVSQVVSNFEQICQSSSSQLGSRLSSQPTSQAGSSRAQPTPSHGYPASTGQTYGGQTVTHNYTPGMQSYGQLASSNQSYLGYGGYSQPTSTVGNYAYSMHFPTTNHPLQQLHFALGTYCRIVPDDSESESE